MPTITLQKVEQQVQVFIDSIKTHPAARIQSREVFYKKY